MNFQYFHYRHFGKNGVTSKGGETYALEEMSLEAFEHLASGPDKKISLKIGMAICSRKDNYNKKLGRWIAEGRATLAMFKVMKVYTQHVTNHQTMVLHNEDTQLTIIFEKKHGSRKVHFVGVL